LSYFLAALLFALLAAGGNALFVYAQKRGELPQNPLLLLSGAAFVCFLILLGTTFFFERPDFGAYARTRGVWMLATGIGLTVTFLGFHFLFTRFGASYYTLYASLAILTTSVGVGFFAYREPINGYVVASTVAALVAMGLLGVGLANRG